MPASSVVRLSEEEKLSSQVPENKKQKKKPIFDPTKNHGRYAAADYTGCVDITVAHAHLRKGDRCPDCEAALQNGKLYVVPKWVIRLQGSPIITGTRYQCEHLRCTLCAQDYKVSLPPEVAGRPKYDETARSSIAIARYYTGIPFKRLELLQSLQGIPLADATQWDQMQPLYEVALPVHRVLEQCAAQGRLVHYDDTPNCILEAKVNKKAVHTTAFISMQGSHAIYLFYTSERYAAQNVELLLAERTSDEPFFSMTDASSQNFPKYMDEELLARWILCFCLVHGRRKFYEIFNAFPVECECVLDIISQVYQHDAHCKKNQYSAHDRLLYHQQHSAPLMESLHVWLNNQLLHRVSEENSGLGQAIRYMLRHWIPLTQFMRHAGAPLDNSICEQAIKVAIRHRRNSLFYKTYKGAQVGDCLMSIIHTCAKNKVNIFDYLNALQRYGAQVSEHPSLWLPWNYQEPLTILNDSMLASAA